MKVLMLTGDKRMLVPGTEAYARLELQRKQVDVLDALYWGRGALFAPMFVRGEYDVVTVQDPLWRGLAGWVIARRLGARLNVQVHMDLGRTPRSRREKSRWGRAEICAANFGAKDFSRRLRGVLAGFVLRRADSVRVVSEKIKEQVESLGVCAPVRVLPVYIDLSRFRTVVREPHGTKTILWVGRFEAEKDPELALEVFKKVRESTDARLVMLGKGSMERALKAQAVGLPVEFPGWRDPLPYYATADVVLSTSSYESFGASIVEALAAGVPTVAPDVGIAREAGATVVPRERLAQAVAELLRSPAARGELRLALLAADAWGARWKESLV